MYNYFKGVFFISKYYLLKVFKINLFKKQLNQISLIIVLPDEESESWILNTIANKIKGKDESIKICRLKEFKFTSAKVLLMHYSLIRPVVSKGIKLSNLSIWFTHPRNDLKNNFWEFKFYFKFLSNIFISCSRHKINLEKMFGASESYRVVLGGFDPIKFGLIQGGARDLIGLSSSFYLRKNPNTIFNVISSLPQFKFVLLGKNWESWDRFEELITLPNFKYITPNYDDYSIWYNRMKIFLSLSFLEGGPIPLIEAMACGAYPIVSDTGFAEDIILNNDTGTILKLSLGDKIIVEIITEIMESNIDESLICHDVKNLTWDNFSFKILNLI